MNSSEKKYFGPWLKFHRAPNPQAEISKMRRHYWPIITVMPLIAGAWTFILPETGLFGIGLIIGVIVGILCVYEARLGAMKRIWSTLEEVVDWDRLEGKLNNPPAPTLAPSVGDKN